MSEKPVTARSTSVMEKSQKRDRPAESRDAACSGMRSDGNYESVIFVRLDNENSPLLGLGAYFRSIHDSVRCYMNTTSCLDAVRSIKEKIFFICSFFNLELLTTVHKIENIDAIFILDSNSHDLKGDFPKLIGIFSQHEELFRSLKETLDIFEQIQLEEFSFENEKLFIWHQLCKEELINRKSSVNKTGFLEMTRLCYRENGRILEIIDEFEKSYRPMEVLHWCLRAPFPKQFLHHAIQSHNMERLNTCRFIYNDLNRFFQQQSKPKSTDQFYRGMKLTNELLSLFESHVGQLVCTSGFFPCMKSRTNALSLASSPGYRSDLCSVLFKIDCDPTSPFTQLSSKTLSNIVAFDISISFRIINVQRGQMTVIKMKPVVADGKRIAQDYLQQQQNQSIQSVLGQLLSVPRAPTPPPPVVREPTPVLKSTPVKPPDVNSSPKEDHESEAKKHLEQNEIDLAVAAYRRVQPASARILITMARLYIDKKTDHKSAADCYNQAVKIQEETGEDFTQTLVDLGNSYRHCDQYSSALDCYRRALSRYESVHPNDTAGRVNCLVTLGNIYCACQQYEQAIESVQRALTLQETVQPVNEQTIGNLLATLGSIYQDCGKHPQALENCTRALTILERTLPADSQVIADLLENMGSIQMDLRLLDEAKQSFQRALNICTTTLPRGHPLRVSADMGLQRVNRLIHKKKGKSTKRT